MEVSTCAEENDAGIAQLLLGVACYSEKIWSGASCLSVERPECWEKGCICGEKAQAEYLGRGWNSPPVSKALTRPDHTDKIQ